MASSPSGPHSGDPIGGTAAAAGDPIASTFASGVAITSGHGNAILSNTIFANAVIGINLAAGADDGIAAPTFNAATPDTLTGTTDAGGAS